LIKFGLDQTVGAAFNIPLFLATMEVLKLQGLRNISSVIQKVYSSERGYINFILTIFQDAWSIYLAGLKLWPAVSIVSFAAIPVEQRVIFGSIAGVIWNVYLSFKADL
jgi:protein Mpv17